MLKVRSPLKFLSPMSSQPHLPLFIFLPGMDGTGKLYQRQAKALSHWFDTRCLSIPVDDRSDWNVLSREVINLIKDELWSRQKENHQLDKKGNKIDNSVYLCGESFGGCLTLKVALEDPSLFKGLILVNPASCFNQRPLLTWAIPLTEWVPDLIHRTSALGVLPFLASLHRISSKDRRDLLEAMRSLPNSTVAWRLSLLRDFFLEEKQLKRLTQPTLLLAGSADRLLPSVQEIHKLKNYLPHAETLILPESGHACLLESKIDLDKILQSSFLPLVSGKVKTSREIHYFEGKK